MMISTTKTRSLFFCFHDFADFFLFLFSEEDDEEKDKDDDNNKNGNDDDDNTDDKHCIILEDLVRL